METMSDVWTIGRNNRCLPAEMTQHIETNHPNASPTDRPLGEALDPDPDPDRIYAPPHLLLLLGLTTTASTDEAVDDTHAASASRGSRGGNVGAGWTQLVAAAAATATAVVIVFAAEAEAGTAEAVAAAAVARAPALGSRDMRLVCMKGGESRGAEV